jgi:hypothetical protein
MLQLRACKELKHGYRKVVGCLVNIGELFGPILDMELHVSEPTYWTKIITSFLPSVMCEAVWSACFASGAGNAKQALKLSIPDNVCN